MCLIFSTREGLALTESSSEVGRTAQNVAQESLCVTSSGDSGGDFKITIDADRVTVKDPSIPTTVDSLEAIYKYKEQKVNEAVTKGLGGETKDQEIQSIQPKCLYVLLHCFTDERFLEVLNDFKSERMMKRLHMEFSFIGIQTEKLVVDVENIKEVEERATAVNER